MRNAAVVVAAAAVENSWEKMFAAAAADQNMCWNSQDSLDLQGSNHTGGDAVHTGLKLAAATVENKRKAPKTDKSSQMDHIHYLRNVSVHKAAQIWLNNSFYKTPKTTNAEPNKDGR